MRRGQETWNSPISDQLSMKALKGKRKTKVLTKNGNKNRNDLLLTVFTKIYLLYLFFIRNDDVNNSVFICFILKISANLFDFERHDKANFTAPIQSEDWGGLLVIFGLVLLFEFYWRTFCLYFKAVNKFGHCLKVLNIINKYKASLNGFNSATMIVTTSFIRTWFKFIKILELILLEILVNASYCN